MKYISLLLLLTIVLSSCFSKNVETEPELGSGSQQTEESGTSDEDIPGETSDDIMQEDEEDIPSEEEALFEENNESGQEEVQESSTDLEVADEDDTQSGTIQEDELESYEADLEALFEDILGELDEQEASE